MIFSQKTVVLFFLACILIGGMLIAAIAFMPIDAHNVCAPYVNQTRMAVNFYCVCSQNITWP